MIVWSGIQRYLLLSWLRHSVDPSTKITKAYQSLNFDQSEESTAMGVLLEKQVSQGDIGAKVELCLDTVELLYKSQ